MQSVPVPINVRCYSNSEIVLRRNKVTLRAKSGLVVTATTINNSALKPEALMTTKRILACLVIVVAVSVSTIHAHQSADPRVADIVHAGKLRVGLGVGSPVLALKDLTTGEIRGPALGLARALAKKIGVEVAPVEYPRPGAVLAGLKNNGPHVFGG
jgi:hypothetical protein